MSEGAPTESDVVEFIYRLAYWRGEEMMENDAVWVTYPTAEARILGLAKRTFEAMLGWEPMKPARASTLTGLVEMLSFKLKTAAVNKEAGRVQYQFTGAELINLRDGVQLLTEYEIVRANDRSRQSRGGRR